MRTSTKRHPNQPLPATHFSVLALILTLVASGCRFAQPVALLPAHTVVLGPESLADFAPSGDDQGDMELDVVELSEPRPAATALRLKVREGESAWSMGLTTKTRGPMAEGDVLLATFELRCVESMTGQAVVDFVFRDNSPYRSQGLMVQVGAGSDWTRINLPFTAKRGQAAGEATAGFQLALADQVLEIADFRILNFGPDVDIDTLPKTEMSYEGRGPDAAWREVAAKKIDRNRKADLTVRVLNAEGKPVPDADVRVEMTRHAFPFGTAIAVSKMLLDSPDGERYRTELKDNFNAGGFESAMKWNNYGTGTPEQIRAALDRLAEMNIAMRGHVIMWPSWRWVHPDILPLRADPPAFRKAIEDRVTGMVTTYRDDIQDWDVLNEAYSNHDVMDMFGDEIIIDWFKLAHEANPDAQLYINDNDTITAADGETTHTKAYYELIRWLLDRGAPVHGIGMQGHFATTLTAPQQVWETLDRFSEFGLPIKITEFDIRNEDPQLQADYQRDFLTAVFAHESVAGFQMWGFWEGQHWRPDAAIYDQHWNLRPHGRVYRDLVYNQWWTDHAAKTDAQGNLEVRGFLGDYRITVTGPDGETHQATATLGRPAASVTVKLKP